MTNGMMPTKTDVRVLEVRLWGLRDSYLQHEDVF